MSTDEKTGMQALERLHEPKPVRPGLVERVEFEYIRHGTLSLIANFDVATGKDPAHRIRFVYTPRHCSWLNQVEIWFSILARRLLKRSSFTSLEDLRTRVAKFIDSFNDVLAKPFRWTYTGRPLRA
jgi:transposase